MVQTRYQLAFNGLDIQGACRVPFECAIEHTLVGVVFDDQALCPDVWVDDEIACLVEGEA